jgi:FkbM family methyltransferase
MSPSGHFTRAVRNKFVGLRALWYFDNWFELWIDRVFLRSKEQVIYRIGQIEILVNHAAGDAIAVREVLTSAMYRRFFPHLKLGTPANVLDLGANCGSFPILLKLEGVPINRVVSVECNPNTFLRLTSNLKRNLEKDTLAVSAAVCGEARTLELYFGQGSATENIYSDMPQPGRERSRVQGITLDMLYDAYFKGQIVDICKMDIEGAEFEVFQAPHHRALERCRYLIMEIHAPAGSQERESLIQRIKSLGFDEIRVSGRQDYVSCFHNLKIAH